MNQAEHLRPLLAPAAIVAAIAIGAHATLLDPQYSEAASLRARMHAVTSDGVLPSADSTRRMALIAERLRRLEPMLERVNAGLPDEGALYALFAEAAERHGVKLRRFAPNEPTTPAEGVHAQDVQLEAMGPCESVRDFLADTEAAMPFMTLGEFTARPAGSASGDDITAVVRVRFHDFSALRTLPLTTQTESDANGVLP